MAEKRTARTLDQRIAAKEDELKKKESELRALKKKARDEERRARTKRLVEVGATVESALGMELDERGRKALYAWLTDVHKSTKGGTWTLAERFRIESGRR